jgi:hypothetical protein
MKVEGRVVAYIDQFLCCVPDALHAGHQLLTSIQATTEYYGVAHLTTKKKRFLCSIANIGILD